MPWTQSHCISARRGHSRLLLFSPKCSTVKPRSGSSASSGPPGTRKGLLLTACHGSVSSLASKAPEASPLHTSTMGLPVLQISLPSQTLPFHAGPSLGLQLRPRVCSPAQSGTWSHCGLDPFFQPQVCSRFPSRTFFFGLSNFCVDTLSPLSP